MQTDTNRYQFPAMSGSYNIVPNTQNGQQIQPTLRNDLPLNLTFEFIEINNTQPTSQYINIQDQSNRYDKQPENYNPSKSFDESRKYDNKPSPPRHESWQPPPPHRDPSNDNHPPPPPPNDSWNHNRPPPPPPDDPWDRHRPPPSPPDDSVHHHRPPPPPPDDPWRRHHPPPPPDRDEWGYHRPPPPPPGGGWRNQQSDRSSWDNRDYHRGPPSYRYGYHRGPSPYHRGPPPDYHRGPPHDRPRGPPPDRFGSSTDRLGQESNHRWPPPDQRGPSDRRDPPLDHNKPLDRRDQNKKSEVGAVPYKIDDEGSKYVPATPPTYQVASVTPEE